MKIEKSFNNLLGTNTSVCFETPDQCPRCHAYIEPEIIDGFVNVYNEVKQPIGMTVHYLCKRCSDTFISKYSLTTYYRDFRALLIESEPTSFTPIEFPENVSNLSPNFVKIYNEAAQAEILNLNEICGMGYRKALEFLVKDYSKIEYPDQAESIEAKPLSSCIRTYINDDSIQALATASAWIGNDNTHYIKKHSDKDVNYLKKLIGVMVSLIETKLTIKEASEFIDPKQ